MTLDEMKKMKQECGISLAQLSVHSNVPLGTLQKIFSGETENPRYATRQAIERALINCSRELLPAESKTVTYSFNCGSQRVEESFRYNASRSASAAKKQGEYTLEDYYALHAGAGANLDEVAAPAYLDTLAGRVALIATATMKNTAAIAGKQSRRFPGRPGLNGLRVEEHLQVTQEQMDVIREIAERSHINAQADISRAEGYTPMLPKDVSALKELKFKVGENTRYITHPMKEDMERIEKAIYEAQMQADYILVSIHSHELSGDKKENPADFLKEFAHRCIDAGAHAIIGHGPHLLRPVEIYKNRPIFYSLGDFVIHNECIPFAPEEMYAKQHLTSDATMRELFYDRA